METETATVQSLAAEMAEAFETATRPDGQTFDRLKQDSPQWMTDVVREAHGDMLPDDWRYACIRAACQFIAEGDAEDRDAEFADSQVDIYTAGLFTWLASNLTRQGYVDEAAEAFDLLEPSSVTDAIVRGQYAEAFEVYGLVLQALESATA